MKKLSLICFLSCASLLARADGTVLFNSSSFPVAYTNNLMGGVGLTATNVLGFYYALFTAPAGTTDPELFSFSGYYATNATSAIGAGRFNGGTVTIPGVSPETDPLAVIVRGWSSNLGSTWAQIDLQRTSSLWNTTGFYGETDIANIQVGGGLVPPGHIFGSSSDQVSEIILYAVVPEPASFALVGCGIVLLSVRRLRR